MFILSGVQTTLGKQRITEKKTLKRAFSLVYLLAKQEILNTEHFYAFLESLCEDLESDASYQALMEVANVDHTNQRIMYEMLECISDQIHTAVLTDVGNSTFYSLLIDVPTDNSFLDIQHMTIVAKFINSTGDVKTAFLGNVELETPNWKPIPTHEAIQTFLSEKNLPSASLISIVSDSAPVMFSKKDGVATQMKSDCPELINSQIAAHRLSIALKQAVCDFRHLQRNFEMTMEQLMRYFKDRDIIMDDLEEIQNVLWMKPMSDTRSNSHELVAAVRKCYPAIFRCLEKMEEEKYDITAIGLLSFMMEPQFVCGLAMFSDLLPHLHRLSIEFQKSSGDFAMIDAMVCSAQTFLKHMLDHPGEHMNRLRETCDDLDVLFNFEVTDDDITHFTTDIYRKYIENVIENLNDKFPDTDVLDAMSVFDPNLIFEDDVVLQKIDRLAAHFISIGTSESARSEIKTLRELMKSQTSNLTFRDALMKICKLEDLYPMCSAYCKAALILLPVSTADCERSFSIVDRIKKTQDERYHHSQRILNFMMNVSIEGPDIDYMVDSYFDYDSCMVRYDQKQYKIPVSTD